MAFAAPRGDAVKKSGAQEYFGDVVKKVGEMRVKKEFQYHEGADAVSLHLHEQQGSMGC